MNKTQEMIFWGVLVITTQISLDTVENWFDVLYILFSLFCTFMFIKVALFSNKRTVTSK